MKDDTNNVCSCTSQFYIILALSASIFGLVFFAIWQARMIKSCRGQLFSNAVEIMLFIFDVQCYVPIKLCKTAERIHLFKVIDTRKGKVKETLHLGYLRCRLERGQGDI